MEKIISEIKSTAKSAMKKSSELFEISKLKIASYDTQGDIEKAFKKLGKLVYEADKSGETDEEAIRALFEEIDALYEKLAMQEEQTATLKKEKKCKICGQMCSEKSAFCSSCGEKL